ncbi:stage II sporulation protein P [Bacillus weihaiensis]|uniref:Stage II sporulation protein P n=1 Tax=Bacillus weihaiensis TaxID=1547283 RepID=A0A1L3MMX0_9BACI|nr:stage II sporulation protein P [Bacillus weihaiensis]APH03700.1 hypothetical protein A9C19_02400 [Bacillus weihaiensis]
MRIEDELFNNIKNSDELTPSYEFVQQTRRKLNKEAEKYSRKKQTKKYSFYLVGTLSSLLLFSWIAFFGGFQYLTKSAKEMNTTLQTNQSSLMNSNQNTPIEIFIYHTHNTESFTPLLNIQDPAQAIHEEKNITLVGLQLVKALERRNIPALQDTTNIQQILKEKELSYSHSYTISRNIMEEALQQHKEIKLMIDLHRSAQKRSMTTTKVNGKDTAKITFVVSKLSKNYKENRKIAELLHQKLEKHYPTVSTGVWIKEGNETENTYNQDVFENTLLINLGGVENTLEEESRSVELLANVIKEVVEESK